jgi:hypothetical protein
MGSEKIRAAPIFNVYGFLVKICAKKLKFVFFSFNFYQKNCAKRARFSAPASKDPFEAVAQGCGIRGP